MRVVVTAAAEADLDDIGSFIAEDNPARAVSFVQDLSSACWRLGDTALGYPLVERYRSRGIRRRPFGRYLIFYRVVNDTVEVLHVLNGARDYESILSAEGPD